MIETKVVKLQHQEIVKAHIPDLSGFLTDPDKMAIMTVKNRTELLLLAEIEFNGDSASTVIHGTPDATTLSVFNMLCANCSSRTPTVINHRIECSPRDQQALESAYNNSRLGRYTKTRLRVGGVRFVLITELVYPS